LPNQCNGDEANANQRSRRDEFYTRVVEYAVAYFGSRVLYPSRPSVNADDVPQLSRAGCEKAAQAAIRADHCAFETSSREWGYRIGSELYESYLAGRVTPGMLRRLFLAHLDEPGLASKVCVAVIAKLRSFSRPLARSAHA
jgi:hypothetical protein